MLDDPWGFGIPALVQSGGEPLSRFDFRALAERARAQNFRQHWLSTNNTKLTAVNAERVASGFDPIVISLDEDRV